MNRVSLRVLALAIAGTVAIASSGHAATIMKLHFGANGNSNFGYSGNSLSTLDDGATSTNGNLDATIEIPDAAQWMSLSASSSSASFTLKDLSASSVATVFRGSLLVQNFIQGELAVYDVDNSLLLSADLSTSAITGALSAPNAATLFLAFGKITGGSMADGLDPDSLRLRMKLPAVTNGLGVSPTPSAPPPLMHWGELNSFTASSQLLEILAEPSVIPEPGCMVLMLCAFASLLTRRSRWRS